MTCTIIAAVVTCVLAPGEKKITAQQAVDILKPNQYVHVPRTYGPTVPSTLLPPSRAQSQLTKMAWPRRLDGTRREDPPVVYGGYPPIQIVVSAPGMRRLPAVGRTSDRTWIRRKVRSEIGTRASVPNQPRRPRDERRLGIGQAPRGSSERPRAVRGTHARPRQN
jgi:hypothetical protein